MSRKTLAIPAALLFVALAAPAPVSASHLDRVVGGDVIVAVIDTGVFVNHTEFDYAANAGTGLAPAGQFVAWWDFTDENGAFLAPGASTWDTRWGPYDNNGHGTGTAGRIGGATTSINPGAKIAIAKVGTGDGAIMNIDAAYSWAVDVVHADVVSISIGSIVPLPNQFDPMAGLIHEALAQGVTTVVSAGNGYGNACIGPAFSWTTLFGGSRDVISVGSLFDNGDENLILTCSAWSPDVTGPGYDVTIADVSCATCYTQSSGTSFAAPWVAGAAAEAIAANLAGGVDPGPIYIKELLQSCATDMGWTYTLQGWGMIDAAASAAANTAAATGSTCAGLPSDPTLPLASKTAYAGRYAFSGPLGGGGQVLVHVGAPTLTLAGQIGPSVPVGVQEIETYTTTLTRGVPTTIGVTWTLDGVTDIDAFLLPASAVNSGPIFLEDALAFSANGAASTESITFTPAWDGAYVILVIGWSVPLPTAVTVTGATYASESLYVSQDVI